MGFIQQCNMCKSSPEFGEVDTNNYLNNMKAKKNFEEKIKNKNI
jgi:hypothetical protein